MNENILITADSTCDLPETIIEKYNIHIFPLTITLGGGEYKDGVDIKPADIYKFADENGELPKTAAVTPNDYYDFFAKAHNEGKSVVHIGLSSAISSSFNNARMAGADFDGEVFCIDSKSLCTAMGLLVLKACDYREEGYDAKKIAKKVEKLVPKLSTTFVLNSLDYLHKGGRCSGIAKLGANLLGIKPSIAVNESGALDVAKKYRGKIDIVYKQYINDCLSDVGKIDTSRIVIANSGQIDPATLAFAKGVVEGKGKFEEIIEADAGCTISSHCGPKTLAIFYINK